MFSIISLSMCGKRLILDSVYATSVFTLLHSSIFQAQVKLKSENCVFQTERYYSWVNTFVLTTHTHTHTHTSPVSLQTDSKRYLSWAFNLNVYLSKQINTHTHIAYNVHLKMQHAPNIFTFVMVYKSVVNKG